MAITYRLELVVPVHHFDVEVGEVGNLLPAVQHILELVCVVLGVPPEHVRGIPTVKKKWWHAGTVGRGVSC